MNLSEEQRQKIVDEMKKDFLERAKGQESRVLSEILDEWLRWVKNGGNRLSCESMSELGRDVYNYLDDFLHQTGRFGGKDPYG